MPDYNVMQAAAYIGCDPKTVRRMLKRGQLTAERTSRGWLAIPAWQVEQARIDWQVEQARFEQPNERLDSTGQHEDILPRIETLERKVAQLEAMLSNASLDVPTEQKQALPQQNYAIDDNTQQSHSTTFSDANKSTLLPAVEFSKSIGIKHTIVEGMIRRGQLECTRIPHPTKKKPDGTPASQYFFSPEQAEQAIALLRSHGKIR